MNGKEQKFDRERFVRDAVRKGIPLAEIEEYLEWRDLLEQADSDNERQRLLDLKKKFLDFRSVLRETD